ncbi:16S rRNA (cytosine(1402)-N(4))-methyltransferase RsmH [candidate division KSB1 bacterium]|nr:16S rRNA (cytosine(1402)-N(4))-methyltransferase RsmH [candidate division KSB1 bacterium]
MHKTTQKTFYHDPVLLEESVSYLLTDPSGIYVDCTLGGGGHSEAILEKLAPVGRLIGIDRDETAIQFASQRLQSYKNQFQAVCSPFSKIEQVLQSLEIHSVSGLLLDLGISSPQIDEGERGFSYMTEGPLDMRMSSDDPISAFDIINTYPERELADLFYIYSEERLSRRIARKIVHNRNESPIRTTRELADIVRGCVPGKYQIKSLSRVFQALRIVVNQELDQLKHCFQNGYSFLAPCSRVVVITYHSLEARMVKRYFRGDDPTFSKEDPVTPMPKYHFRILTKKAILPSEAEIQRNPRARSAALRCGERIEIL